MKKLRLTEKTQWDLGLMGFPDWGMNQALRLLLAYKTAKNMGFTFKLLYCNILYHLAF